MDLFYLGCINSNDSRERKTSWRSEKDSSNEHTPTHSFINSHTNTHAVRQRETRRERRCIDCVISCSLQPLSDFNEHKNQWSRFGLIKPVWKNSIQISKPTKNYTWRLNLGGGVSFSFHKLQCKEYMIIMDKASFKVYWWLLASKCCVHTHTERKAGSSAGLLSTTDSLIRHFTKLKIKTRDLTDKDESKEMKINESRNEIKHYLKIQLSEYGSYHFSKG